MSEFVNLRSKSTGAVGKYPAQFRDLFDDLEEVDEDEAVCVGCMIFPQEEEATNEVVASEDQARAIPVEPIVDEPTDDIEDK